MYLYKLIASLILTFKSLKRYDKKKSGRSLQKLKFIDETKRKMKMKALKLEINRILNDDKMWNVVNFMNSLKIEVESDELAFSAHD